MRLLCKQKPVLKQDLNLYVLAKYNVAKNTAVKALLW